MKNECDSALGMKWNGLEWNGMKMFSYIHGRTYENKLYTVLCYNIGHVKGVYENKTRKTAVEILLFESFPESKFKGFN